MIYQNETQARRGRGGSTSGRLTHRTKTKVPGIRFDWTKRPNSIVLLVVATWRDKDRPRRTAFSTEVHGLEVALDKAIAARTSAGAPMPDRDQLLEMLRAEFATAGKGTKTA